MNIQISRQLFFIIFLIFLLTSTVRLNAHEVNQKQKSKSLSAAVEADDNCSAVHSLGNFVLGVGGSGTFGGTSNIYFKDCFTNTKLLYRNSEYPKGSYTALMSSVGTWFGGIVGSDSLVTQSNYGEIFPQSSDDFEMKTIIEESSSFSLDAISELDFVFTSYDNIPREGNNYRIYHDDRPHKQLGIKTIAKTFSWSYGYAEDFVLIELTIKNVSSKRIRDFYFGFNGYEGSGYNSLLDKDGKGDIIGLLKDVTFNPNCEVEDTLNLMWMADSDGDPYEGKFHRNRIIVRDTVFRSAPDVAGVFHLKNYADNFSNVNMSYNWVVVNNDKQDWFMPMARGGKDHNYRHETAHLFSDVDRYALMSNNEIDYDQTYTATIFQSNQTWKYPDQTIATDLTTGFSSGHVHHIFSIGPFDLGPGTELTIPFAVVAGSDLHKNPTNLDYLPDFPALYNRNLDFSDIVKNAQWARWVYDNPGVDTDGDGDFGLYKICVIDSQLIDNDWQVVTADTFWYRGDGIPDWRAATPPPAPYVWLEPSLNSIRVRFNGTRSETEKDIFTQIADFEGYNIYYGRDERKSSLSLVASYDKENYDKFVYHFDIAAYRVEDVPLTIHEIRCAYAANCDDEFFDPLMYTRTNPIEKPDSLIFFKKHSFNVANSEILKVYPNARDPRTVIPDSLNENDYTNEGHFKFFEYEYTIENLLPTVDYWINVTSFDFGSPKSGLRALESSKLENLQPAFPLTHEDDLSTVRKQVYVYPNPYRIDANYRDDGYEGRIDENRPDFRLRELNFANLPPKCEIKILSLDGDLIKHLSHDKLITDPNHTHEKWDLITRNIQMLVSGLYYWTVEFPDGEVQIGKFVVLM